MKKIFASSALALAIAGSLFAGTAAAGDSKYQYHITITNLTKNINFTPIMVATHAAGVKLFAGGQAASAGVEQMAEGGDTTTLLAELDASGKLHDSTSTGALLHPGESVEVYLSTTRKYNHVSVASMMLPTNDSFIAVNGVAGPRKGTRVVHSPGYDAGTEYNDELCASIPGPTCGGEGFNAAGGEGYVHINNGIQGDGDLNPSVYDWRNPAAHIVIHRVKVSDDD